ncbi:Ubiquitin carboxyl-terminal hydrolase [Lachnellula suecica]|uniref:Ubiquitin carboxyl-terminal hydrolase n=1 Tax=Lachnellula suecica TaxID=602035 RepID=A0A8T9BZ91_9HELO|nr:Ubiquitin carboxyl-terminal hydrolase [Lachnellula suecica]
MDQDQDPAERERAVSSEPCSASRPNPFDETASSSRKRQRVSREGSVSRSRSVETARDDDDDQDLALPRTPTRMPSDGPPPEPTSSRVTINLRTARPLDPIPSSPPSPATPSKMGTRREDVDADAGTGTRVSVESESDALSTVPAIETPSSSPSEAGSPKVELVPDSEDDGDFGGHIPVSLLDGEPMYNENDPMLDFPFLGDDSLVTAAGRLQHYLQYDDVPNEDVFCRFREWTESCLTYASDYRTFYAMYSRNRDFWAVFPEIIWGLSYRSRFFGPWLHNRRDGRLAVTETFTQFARLAGRFVNMDATTLTHHYEKGNTDQIPDLGSAAIVRAYTWLFKREEVQHIGRNLEAHYHWNWDENMSLMMTAFQREGGSLTNLKALVGGQIKLMPQTPKIIEAMVDPCRLAVRIGSDAYKTLEQAPNQEWHENARKQISRAYEFFEVMAVGLHAIIDKHVTLITPDASHVYLSSLTAILRNTIITDNEATRKLVESFRQDHPEIPRKQLAKVISMEWRFNVLRKLITSTQMQLRVVGVTTMCGDLLSLFTQFKEPLLPNPPPILLFFADFVLRNKLVDYVVGIGSHPEIINESSNILGFLIVTRTYTSDLTELIWQTVMTSQDPRVVDAILRMVKQCINLYDYQALLYMCQKTCDLPIEAFTPPMREFCEHLLRNFLNKAQGEGIQYIDAPPYDLCIRLIRQSSIVTPEYPAGYPDIQAFAAARLRELLGHGPSIEIRKSIYESCMDDVASRTPTAPGSICVINTLLRLNRANDLHVLTTEHGLTRLLVEELEQTASGIGYPPFLNSPASLARRELLSQIITHEPDTISPDLGRKLWDHLVGSESRNVIERNIFWGVLCGAMKKSSRNAFISTCFTEYFPTLPPHCFTNGALDFAREHVNTWLKEIAHDSPEGPTLESPALQQIWRMILNAPPNTIDGEAISITVDVYVNSTVITTIPKAKAREIHLTLVDRCLKQLAEAASKLKSFGNDTSNGDDDGMVIVPSEGQFQEQERIFARSLALLREFLKAYQLKPHFSFPKSRYPPPIVSNNVEGEPLTVKYQSFDGDRHTEVKDLTLGKLNTAASLFASLQKATGFKHYKIYCGGKEITSEEIDLCKSLEELNINGLVLVQRREDIDGAAANNEGSKITLEAEILKHFDELWGYLSMHEKVAQEIYYFLVGFPIYDRILENFNSETASYSEIFPAGQPYKSLYAVHALREHIKGRSQKVDTLELAFTGPITDVYKGAVDEHAITRAVTLIVAAISDHDVLENCPSDDLRDFLALHLIDCLTTLLKEPLLPETIPPLLNQALLDRLLHLLQAFRATGTTQNSVHLIFRIFEALLEASLHSLELWTSFISHLKSSHLLQDLVLEDPRGVIRKSVSKSIANKCVLTPSLAKVSSMDFALAFWPMVSTLVAEATHHPQQCEETFQLCLALFKKMAESAISYFNLGDLVNQWGSLLISHECKEVVGQVESIDLVAHGLIHLLYCGASFAKASEQELSCSAIGTELFRRHLFPPLQIEMPHSDAGIVAKMPLLNPMTRHTMSETIFFLVKDDPAQYRTVLSYLENLVPYNDRSDESMGEPRTCDYFYMLNSYLAPYNYELPFLFDRSKSIKSPAGYVGLRNLSNTCYLNSLFTQLFMNVSFREFMLGATVADKGSQRLLDETQTLFSHMQNTLTRFVDPTCLAASIRTYDDTNIDVNIQMDVDEFYNLLFDRWESQMLSPDAKRKFKGFYGGQLVQQVKSKECPHISERSEQFSAIQCDIKGKSCLQESLQAYVDGEVMEGDNKYKCSTCDRHVDAVKRACLKDIPDNLIFHLKRFDFNLRTLQRSKINDHFSFPDKIDMRPFKVEHLMDPSAETPEDVFELVGVLVHAGTAESGHYYSFIRERPSTSDKDNWVEFNDDTVTAWDPGYMEAACFGGPENRGPLDGSLTYDKSYSAYMLFYQRSSVVAAQKQLLEESKLASPVHLPLPIGLSDHIASENELLMRRYCLYDPSHIVFVSKMLGNMKKVNGGHCSTDHILEKQAMFMALHHLDQVCSRAKDLPDFAAFMLCIRQLCNTCGECSRDFLEFFCDYPEALRQLLVKNPEGLVRSEIASAILAALMKMKADATYAYGFEEEMNEDSSSDNDPQVFMKVVKSLNKLWDCFHTSMRAWPEYFGLLASIASMGDLEAAVLLDNSYLRRTLDIISADFNLAPSQQISRMLNIISKRMPTRPVNYEAVITLCLRLLQSCDVKEPVVSEVYRRLDLAATSAPIPFADMEYDHLAQHWVKTHANIFVEKLLQINQNPAATRQILITLLEWPEMYGHHSRDDIDSDIYHTLHYGIRKSVSAIPCSPFLKAAVIYCEHTQSDRSHDLITHIAKVAGHIETAEGRDFLLFFKNIMNIQTTSTNSNTTPEELASTCLHEINLWAPNLLTHYDSAVRTETEEYLIDTIFTYGPEESPDDFDTTAREYKAAQRLGMACLDYLNEVYVRPRQSVVSATLVSILAIIEHSVRYFEQGEKSPLVKLYFEKRGSILQSIKKYTVEEADDGVESDADQWDASEDEYGSSEPMGDSINDLCAPGLDDI